jgi:hypothetical protein
MPQFKIANSPGKPTTEDLKQHLTEKFSERGNSHVRSPFAASTSGGVSEKGFQGVGASAPTFSSDQNGLKPLRKFFSTDFI